MEGRSVERKKKKENLSDVICVLLWIKAKRKRLADILNPFFFVVAFEHDFRTKSIP